MYIKFLFAVTYVTYARAACHLSHMYMLLCARPYQTKFVSHFNFLVGFAVIVRSVCLILFLAALKIIYKQVYPSIDFVVFFSFFLFTRVFASSSLSYFVSTGACVLSMVSPVCRFSRVVISNSNFTARARAHTDER